MDAGDAWFEAIQKRQERNRQISQNGKIADSIVKTNPDILKSLGMGEDEFGTLAPLDKAAKITGAFQAQGYKKALSDLQLLNAKTKEITDRQQADSNMAALMQQAQAGAEQPEQTNTTAGAEAEVDPETGDPAGAASSGGSVERGALSGAARPGATGSGMDFVRMGLKAGYGPREAFDLARAWRASRDLGLLTPTEIPGVVIGPNGKVVQLRKDKQEQPYSPADFQDMPNGMMLNTRKGTLTPAAKTAAEAPAESWVLSDDVDAFKKGLNKIDDPKTRTAVLQMRQRYNLATGKASNEFAELLKGIIGGNGQGQKANGSAASPGTKVRKWNAATKRFE